MPESAELPEEIRPHFERAALVTVDVQRDVLDGGALEVAGTTAALGAMVELARTFRSAGRPIVHVVRLYVADGSNADLSRRRMVRSSGPVLRPGTSGCQLAPGLAPEGAAGLDDALLLAGGLQTIGRDEVAVYKPRWGAFYETGLETHLRGEDVDTLVLCGANFPNCPRATAYEASERDFRVVVAEDAVSGLYDRAIAELRGAGIVVAPTAAVVAGLGARRPP
ncbi:MAG TPA: isochorismatase family cysteine hydrolase [Acidimicrobiales bacterium]|nr:isochorismatase family cysteine hydrolase [Acidimicrobiales bacterium]